MKRRSRYIAMLALCVTSVSCTADALLGSGPGADNETIFDEVWQAFDLHYSYFGIRGVDWNESRRRYRADALAARSEQELATTISEMMRDLRDVHVVLTPAEGISSNRYVSEFERRPTHFSSGRVVDNYIPDAAVTTGENVRYGHLGEKVGYIAIESFRGRGWIAEFDDALRALNAAALVVDVRDNQGGDNGLAVGVASRFADRERTYGYVRLRDGPAHNDFTDYIAERVRPEGPHFSGPVVVLTNRRTMSAGEDFVLAMRAIPGIRVVGDTTAGASGGPIVRELPNGWTFQLSEWIAYTANREPFEGLGLAPDIVVVASAQDGPNDRVLDAARVVALAELGRLNNAPGADGR